MDPILFSLSALLQEPPELTLLQQAHQEQARLSLSALELDQQWLTQRKQQATEHASTLQQLRHSHYSSTPSSSHLDTINQRLLNSTPPRSFKLKPSAAASGSESSLPTPKQEQEQEQQENVGSGRKAAAQKTRGQYEMSWEEATGVSSPPPKKKEKGRGKGKRAAPDPAAAAPSSIVAEKKRKEGTAAHSIPTTPQPATTRPFQPLTSPSAAAPPSPSSSSSSPFRTPLATRAPLPPPNTSINTNTTPQPPPPPPPSSSTSPPTPSTLGPFPLQAQQSPKTAYPLLFHPSPTAPPPPHATLFPGLLFIQPVQFEGKKLEGLRKRAARGRGREGKKVRWQVEERGGGRSESTREVQLGRL